MAKRSMGSRLLSKVPVPARVESALDEALDKALSVQRPMVQRYLARLRQKHPNQTPAETVELLEKRYKQTVIGIGTASATPATVPTPGAAAAAPDAVPMPITVCL